MKIRLLLRCALAAVSATVLLFCCLAYSAYRQQHHFRQALGKKLTDRVQNDDSYHDGVKLFKNGHHVDAIHAMLNDPPISREGRVFLATLLNRRNKAEDRVVSQSLLMCTDEELRNFRMGYKSGVGSCHPGLYEFIFALNFWCAEDGFEKSDQDSLFWLSKSRDFKDFELSQLDCSNIANTKRSLVEGEIEINHQDVRDGSIEVGFHPKDIQP